MTEKKWFSDDLNLKSEKFTYFNIEGLRVEVRKHRDLETTYFNAYVVLEDSNILSDTFLGHPTFRRNDIVGVDTGHTFNEEQTNEERLSSALHQIEYIIKRWKSATEEGYYED